MGMDSRMPIDFGNDIERSFDLKEFNEENLNVLLDSKLKELLDCKYKENPELAGKIRELTNNSPKEDWEIELSFEEVKAFEQFPQAERVELYWMYQLSNKSVGTAKSILTERESLVDFLNRIKKEREAYAISRNNRNDLP